MGAVVGFEIEERQERQKRGVPVEIRRLFLPAGWSEGASNQAPAHGPHRRELERGGEPERNVGAEVRYGSVFSRRGILLEIFQETPWH